MKNDTKTTGAILVKLGMLISLGPLAGFNRTVTYFSSKLKSFFVHLPLSTFGTTVSNF